ncbi:MAG: hypothetical protein QGH58_01720 [Arenicellales bacterium]|nr:hypothetical protein [Arenicellales bacterium]MDP6919217.1 hypothetical protein [Arenicellales bacterium]
MDDTHNQLPNGQQSRWSTRQESPDVRVMEAEVRRDCVHHGQCNCPLRAAHKDA